MADTKNTKKATPLTEEELLAKEADLNTKAEKLDTDIADFESKKAAFLQEKKEFDEDKENWLAQISKEKEVVIEVANPVEFKFEEADFVFAVDAPRNIRIDGVVYSQEEIAENEDLKLQLIGGKSSLIIKK